MSQFSHSPCNRGTQVRMKSKSGEFPGGPDPGKRCDLSSQTGMRSVSDTRRRSGESVYRELIRTIAIMREGVRGQSNESETTSHSRHFCPAHESCLLFWSAVMTGPANVLVISFWLETCLGGQLVIMTLNFRETGCLGKEFYVKTYPNYCNSESTFITFFDCTFDDDPFLCFFFLTTRTIVPINT